MSLFYTTNKRQENSYFLMFSGGIEMEQWPEMGYQPMSN